MWLRGRDNRRLSIDLYLLFVEFEGVVVDWGVSLSELDGVDAECEGAFEEESSSSCCLLSLFLSRRFLDFDDCTRFPLLSDSPATDTCKFERKIATQLISV